MVRTDVVATDAWSKNSDGPAFDAELVPSVGAGHHPTAAAENARGDEQIVHTDLDSLVKDDPFGSRTVPQPSPLGEQPRSVRSSRRWSGTTCTW